MNYRKHLVIAIPFQGDLEGWIYVIYSSMGDKIATSTEHYITKLQAEVAAKNWLDRYIEKTRDPDPVYPVDDLITQMKWAR